ncbi:hypothetical protein ACFX2I_039221 [Malus domestica]
MFRTTPGPNFCVATRPISLRLHSTQISTSVVDVAASLLPMRLAILLGSLSAGSGIAPQLHEPKAGVVASINDVAQELMSVLLSMHYICTANAIPDATAPA